MEGGHGVTDWKEDMVQQIGRRTWCNRLEGGHGATDVGESKSKNGGGERKSRPARSILDIWVNDSGV
ncbi:hypothetical protein SDJN03_22724, partial [Cucurbita argyrosperma subsp. sororia]